MKFNYQLAALSLFLLTTHLFAERINQDGRVLDPLPAVTNSVLFNTTNADAMVSAMQIFPVTNPWNEDISRRPLLPNSDAMIAQINTNVPSASNRTLKLFQEMNYVLAPDNQPLVPFEFVAYPGESDLNGGTSPNGLYPIPTNMPVEGWPTQSGGQTLAQWQTNYGGDRHSIIVQPGNGLIYESWQAQLTNGNWKAANGAIFNLNTNGLREDGWTSGDAAGFPMFPALVRFDECERGMVEHACRLVVVNSRAEHIYPARHDAGSVSADQTNYPAMGQRLRLKASYVITNSWTTPEKALLLGLKKYGAMVSDNSSSFFSISITPDDRWQNAFDNISNFGLAITNFEVIQTTRTNEGPRSAGAPIAFAGADATATVDIPFQMQGFVSFTSPTTNQWKLYSGPTNLTFANVALTNTTVTFNTNGVFTLMLSADDGVHAVAYDAVVITVTQGITLNIALVGTNVSLSWNGGVPPFVVEQMDFLPASSWSGVVTTSLQTASVPLTSSNNFFRVRGN